MQTDINDILKKNQLSVTDSRKSILDLFIHTNGALAHADIEKQTGEKFDRVTVYRTLQVFMEKGIIHTIPTSDNSIRYALCKDECAGGHHHDNHVHFLCTVCGLTTCLDFVNVPEVNLPKGFKVNDSQMILKGICEKCQQ